jgi:small subunit ribosomal protein S6
MNKAYELTIVLDGKATSAKKKDASSRVEKMVKANGGGVLKADDWGTKDLAYPIGKSELGAYLYFDLEMPPAAAKEINEKLRLENDIIRYLLVTSETNGKKS